MTNLTVNTIMLSERTVHPNAILQGLLIIFRWKDSLPISYSQQTTANQIYRNTIKRVMRMAAMTEYFKAASVIAIATKSNCQKICNTAKPSKPVNNRARRFSGVGSRISRHWIAKSMLSNPMPSSVAGWSFLSLFQISRLTKPRKFLWLDGRSSVLSTFSTGSKNFSPCPDRCQQFWIF